MSKYVGLIANLIVTCLMIFYTAYDNEKLGNVLWFWFLLISVISITLLFAVKSEKVAEMATDSLPYTWTLSVACVAMMAFNGWFFVALLFAMSMIGLQLKLSVGKDRLGLKQDK